METKESIKYGQNDFCADQTIINNEIKPLIAKLFQVEEDKSLGAWKGLQKQMKEQDQIMSELKSTAKRAGAMLGRVIKFPHADSHAVYIVTKVNKSTCRLKWLDYCDGWQDSRLGEEGSLNINYVCSEITREDRLDELFGK